MAFAPVSCASWFGWSFNAEAWRESQKAKAKERNLQWFLHLGKVMKDKLNDIGFNAEVADICGVSCFAASRKYPNLYTSFYIGENDQPGMITWKYYINEKHWYSLVMSWTEFLDMIGEIGNSREDKLGNMKFDVEPAFRNYTVEHFNKQVEMMIHADSINAVSLQFHVEDVNGTEYHLDKNYFKGKVNDEIIHYYYNEAAGKLDFTRFKFDDVSKKLAYLFINN